MTPLTQEIGYLLSRASGIVVQATNAALSHYGLRVRSYSVLALACDSRGGITQRSLATQLGLDPSQVVALVDDLVGAGLVERRHHDADRRTRLVAATAAGRRLRRTAARVTQTQQATLLAGLSATDVSRLRETLTRILSQHSVAG